MAKVVMDEGKGAVTMTVLQLGATCELWGSICKKTAYGCGWWAQVCEEVPSSWNREEERNSAACVSCTSLPVDVALPDSRTICVTPTRSDLPSPCSRTPPNPGLPESALLAVSASERFSGFHSYEQLSGISALAGSDGSPVAPPQTTMWLILGDSVHDRAIASLMALHFAFSLQCVAPDCWLA